MSGVVTVPPVEVGQVRVGPIVVERSAIDVIRYGHRAAPSGTYTGLWRSGRLWMSDTPAEQRDHVSAVYEARTRGGRILVNGLGLGMYLQMILQTETRWNGEERPSIVEHVDVVELDPDVIAAVGPHYEAAFPGKVTIHQGDAHDIAWLRGTRWTYAWHDIWEHITTDDDESRARLNRRYGRRVDAQSGWAQYEVERVRRAERQHAGLWF